MKTATLSLISSVLLSSLISASASAHGEDKPGPHGGAIRMPGPFHVEVVPDGEKIMKVYLLDMNWASPTTKDSQVEAAVGKNVATCAIQGDHYECRFTKAPGRGQLTVKSRREGQAGNEARYDWPVKVPAAKAAPAGHHGH